MRVTIYSCILNGEHMEIPLMQRIGIAVTGYPGSGSTSLCENLTSKFGWPPHYYAGGVIRWLTDKIETVGVERVLQMTPQEISAAFESSKIVRQPNIASAYRDFPQDLDRLVDEVQESLLLTKSVGVHEGRMAPHLVDKIRRSGHAHDKVFLKICCTVNSWEGARRQLNREENKGKTRETTFRETEERLRWERERYKTLYGIEDHLEKRFFEVVIDTTRLSKEEVCLAALRGIEDVHPGILAPHLKEE